MKHNKRSYILETVIDIPNNYLSISMLYVSILRQNTYGGCAEKREKRCASSKIERTYNEERHHNILNMQNF